MGKRFEAYGWRVIKVDDANDHDDKVDKALTEARKSDGRPTMIIGKTKIGFGSPGKQGKASSHGEPLGDEEVAATKKNLGFPPEPFHVLDEVKKACHARVRELQVEAANWDKQFNELLDKNPEMAKSISHMIHKELPEDLLEQLLKAAPLDKPVATRASGGAILQTAAKLVPALCGGAADLAPSTKTDIKGGNGLLRLQPWRTQLPLRSP